MTTSTPLPAIDALIDRETRWQSEFVALRAILRGCDLTETMKWGQPCYTAGGRNIVLIHGFKDYCALLFFKGALLKDAGGVLIQQTQNVQAARQLRFTAIEEITRMDNLIRAYVDEAIAVEKSGQTVSFKTTGEFEVPEEFQARLDGDPDFKAAFEALTPGRQRAWLLHVGSAKQTATRQSRLDKATPAIFTGKGPMDK
ncbi:MAG: YdeI/OmpD-associated family protein [Asticcacaulis sp.]